MIIEKVENKIEIAVEKSEFCRDWRNRHIAHRDLGLIIDEKSVEPLKSASREKIKKAIFALDDVLNTVSKHYKNSTTMFDMFPDPDGAKSLLYVLDDGLLAMEEREKRIRNGNYSDDDFRTKDI